MCNVSDRSHSPGYCGEPKRVMLDFLYTSDTDDPVSCSSGIGTSTSTGVSVRGSDSESDSSLSSRYDPGSSSSTSRSSDFVADAAGVPVDNESTSAHILVHGDLLRKPVSSLSEIQGFEHIKKNLDRDLKVTVGNAMQLHAASHILGGRNCFLVGSPNPRAGKSLSYLIPIVSKLLEDQKGYQSLAGCGPIVIILVATYESGCKLQYCLDYLSFGTNLNWIFLHENDSGNSDESAEDIKNKLLHNHRKYDLIVATAECVADLVQDHHSGFSFDRLSYLIVDDAHLLLKFRQKEVQTILTEFKRYVNLLEGRPCLHQFIFCGSQWSLELEECFKHVTDLPVLIMSSPVQAIKYSNFDVRVVDANEDTRFLVFKGILANHKNMNRIIVVASKFETLKDLESMCVKEGIVIHTLEGEGHIGSRMGAARNLWKSNGGKVIIATTDVNLRELKIKNASMLIHYDIPEDDLRTFALRFSTMWSNVRDLSQEMKCPDPKIPRKNQDLVSYVILLSELLEANMILWKLHTLGAAISKPLLAKAQREKLAKLNEAELCPGFKCMGNCKELDETTCPYRHYFVEQDFKDNPVLPRVGQVEVVITEPLEPNFYNAKILRYCERDPVTKKIIKFTDYGKETLRRHEEIKQLVDSKSIRKPETFSPGTKVVVATREKHESRFVYARGQIINVMTRNQFGFPKEVRVRCLDIGETRHCRVDEIFAMPESMKSLPAHGVQIVLANTAPPRSENRFRLRHISKAKEFLHGGPTYHADIALSIGNTIWVKRLVKLEHLIGGRLVEGPDVTHTLSTKEVLVKNPGHLDKLYAECEKLGFSCEMYRNMHAVYWFHNSDFTKTFYQLNEPYNWAYLRVVKQDGKEIRSASAVPTFITTDNQIFVSLLKFESQAESLEEELDNEIQRLKSEHDWNVELHFHRYYEVDQVVAVKDDEDNKYRRGIITAIEKKEINMNAKQEQVEDSDWLYSVFLVDLGVTGEVRMSSLFPIPKCYVDKLPFQGIKLLVKHIRPRKPKYSADLIYRRTGEFLMPNLQPIEVEVVALSRLNSEETPQCSTYEALIFGDTFEVGEKLVADKFAYFVEDGEARMKEVKAALLNKFQKKCGLLNEDDDDDDDDSEFLDILLFDDIVEQVISSIAATIPATEIPATAQLAIQGPAEVLQESIQSLSLTNSSSTCFTESNKFNGNKIPVNLNPSGSGLLPNKSEIQNDPLKKADVTWCQEADYVYLRVMIPDVQQYNCIVSKSKKEVIFATVLPPDYGFRLQLFKRVEEKVEVKTLGQYCEIKMTKRLRGMRWQMLTNETKLRWLKPESNFEDDEREAFVSITGEKRLEYVEVSDYEAMAESEEDSDEEFVERVPTVDVDHLF